MLVCTKKEKALSKKNTYLLVLFEKSKARISTAFENNTQQNSHNIVKTFIIWE